MRWLDGIADLMDVYILNRQGLAGLPYRAEKFASWTRVLYPRDTNDIVDIIVCTLLVPVFWRMQV